MPEMYYINPEQAAHNVASAFSSKYVNQTNDPAILSSDRGEICEAAREAAKLYAIAYDSAYEYFFNANSDLPNRN